MVHKTTCKLDPAAFKITVCRDACKLDPKYITNFGEEVVRGQPVFVLSILLQKLEPMLRQAAGVAPWQVSPCTILSGFGIHSKLCIPCFTKAKRCPDATNASINVLSCWCCSLAGQSLHQTQTVWGTEQALCIGPYKSKTLSCCVQPYAKLPVLHVSARLSKCNSQCCWIA